MSDPLTPGTDTVEVAAGTPLVGRVRTPGEKSISHRTLLLAALAEGTSTITGLSDGDDVARTAAAVAALGATVTPDGAGGLTVRGGRGRLHPAPGPLDLGNSGTGLRLLAGWLAGFGWATTLVGDESLATRPMDRVAGPLERMGAAVRGRGERKLAPVTVTGGALVGIDHTTPVASAQIKSAVLLAGLAASGRTVVREAVTTRAHTEEMLARAGAAVTVEPWGPGRAGRAVTVRRSTLEPVDWVVPGDPSQAAFWVVAGCIVAGSDVTVTGVYDGPARNGFVSVLVRMGAAVTVTPRADGTVDLRATAGPLRATTVEAAEIPSLDEIPILAVAAAVAEGTTVFRDVAELRVKEVDRQAATVALVEAFGGRAEAAGDELVVHGLGRAGHLSAGSFHSRGDHRLAMAAAVAAAAVPAGSGPAPRSRLDGFAAVGTSYPGFAADLARLTGREPAGPTGPGGSPGPGAGPIVVGPAGNHPLLIAIDGPAGAGKSTVSRLVATRLGLERLDTGAMYRAVAAAALERGVDPADAPAVTELAERATIEVGPAVVIDGRDVTARIRTPEVGRAVSIVAANPGVRRQLVAYQRAWAAARGGGVVEGRDIGTVVFPEAQVKVYLTASPEERARRRHDESPAGVARRDRMDSTRADSPLTRAEDAHLLDTTGQAIEDVVEEVLSWL